MLRKITGIALVCALALGASADIVTNVWINPAGGNWSDPANWQDGAVAYSETVADFRQLASGSTVLSSEQPTAIRAARTRQKIYFSFIIGLSFSV